MKTNRIDCMDLVFATPINHITKILVSNDKRIVIRIKIEIMKTKTELNSAGG